MMNTEKRGIEIVTSTHGEEVARNMQHNPEDREVLCKIGGVRDELNFLWLSHLSTRHPACSFGLPVLVGPDGRAYHPQDVTPCGTIAARLIAGNANSLKSPDDEAGRSSMQLAQLFR